MNQLPAVVAYYELRLNNLTLKVRPIKFRVKSIVMCGGDARRGGGGQPSNHVIVSAKKPLVRLSPHPQEGWLFFNDHCKQQGPPAVATIIILKRVGPFNFG
jgi:hypothetical protein